MFNVGEFIIRTCDSFPRRDVIFEYDTHQKYSYGKWGTDINLLASELVKRGFKAGDFVMIRFGNNYGYLNAYGGASIAGGVTAPIPMRLTLREISQLLAVVKSKWFLTSKDNWLEVADAVKSSSVKWVGLYHDSKWEWLELMGTIPARTPNKELAHLRFTSGSAGDPKVVALNHKNMLYRLGNYNHYALDADVFFLSIPFLFRPDRLIQCLSVGGTVVVSDTILPKQVIKCWQEAKVTFAWLVPTIISLLTQLDPSEIPSDLVLRGINTGGAYLYRHWEQKFEQLYKVPVYQQYGLSEGCVAFENPLEKRLGSVGKPTPTIEAKICDAQGNELSIGQVGELWYRGSNVMQGYLDRPDLTAVTLKNGWLRTGDMARFDEDGYLFIEGRLKDLIHSGGLKFSPREVEEVLLQYPGIIEVSVIAVAHPTKGEVAKAYYVTDKAVRSGDLRAFCRTQLADYKIPKHWEQVSSLPKLLSGKLARRLVGQQ